MQSAVPAAPGIHLASAAITSCCGDPTPIKVNLAPLWAMNSAAARRAAAFWRSPIGGQCCTNAIFLYLSLSAPSNAASPPTIPIRSPVRITRSNINPVSSLPGTTGNRTPRRRPSRCNTLLSQRHRAASS